MKKIAKIAGISLLLVLVVTLLSLRTFGYEPQDLGPGLWLSGEVVDEPVSDWSFTDDFGEIFIQTNTAYFIPHSVTAYCAYYDGNFYLFSAYYEGGTFPEMRSWNKNIMRDPRVRLKIGDKLYDQTVRHITDESVKNPVIESFEKKYPQWNSPGNENVHILLVE